MNHSVPFGSIGLSHRSALLESFAEVEGIIHTILLATAVDMFESQPANLLFASSIAALFKVRRGSAEVVFLKKGSFREEYVPARPGLLHWGWAKCNHMQSILGHPLFPLCFSCIGLSRFSQNLDLCPNCWPSLLRGWRHSEDPTRPRAATEREERSAGELRGDSAQVSSNRSSGQWYCF